MNSLTLVFGYPRRGLSGEFATFRLGVKASQTFFVGSCVDLLAAKTKKLIIKAQVTAVYFGPLQEMADLHSAAAHNWKDHPANQRSALLIASMKKRYFPGQIRETSICSVIYLKEITDENHHHPYVQLPGLP